MGYYITVESGVNVYVEDLNPKGKKTIVFLHGWPGSHDLFEYQFDQLARLDFRCVGLDQRGFGKSDRPSHGYDYNTLSDDVRCVIDTLGLKNVMLVGHSTGGAIAIRYMARHSGYGVAQLVLCAAAAPSLIMRPYFPYGQRAETVQTIIQNTLDDRPGMLRNFSGMFFFQKVSEALKDWFFNLGLQAAGWSTAAIANTWLDEEQLFLDMPEIKAPTLILHGIHDQVCFFPLGQAQNQMIPNSILVPFENSGHALFYEQKDKFNLELIRFADII